ncbi:bck1-like resistance to osmotic shock [Nowakowskiella sp. JEL0407]|nr:bck1-like resistance to osmotic shock [Nowakowskiella sp. JEL0407]
MSAFDQPPLLLVPTKRTDEVEFGPAFRSYIRSVYQDDPDKYSSEIATLHRLRQDIRGAGKDITGRNILYRYYGQLELLDLRFPIDEKNIKIQFQWYDAFSNNAVSQHSIAYEKACVIFNIAATCSAIAASQNRFEPEGLKLAYNYFQTAAGLFSYINDNFLHAPSTDLSKESIKTMVELMLAQAQETFLEKFIAEKKTGSLVSKLAAHAAHAYSTTLDGLQHESIRSQFEKAWLDLVKIKARYFSAMSHLHRGIQLETETKYGECVAHMTQAETIAKEAQKLAQQFATAYPSFTILATSNLTGEKSSSAAAITAMTKSLLQTATEKKNQAVKDNDLIYNLHVPSIETLPPIEKKSVVKLMTFAEVCTNGQADIPKIIGPDIFAKLVPMNVTESSSLYSEEKAKIIRKEQDAVDNANGELQAMLESLNLIPTITKLKNMAKGSLGLNSGITMDKSVQQWCEIVNKEEVSGDGTSTPTHELLGMLDKMKQQLRETLDAIGMQLDREQHECEGLRIRYGDQWTQETSASQTSQIRQEIKQSRESFEKALATDHILLSKLREVAAEIDILKRPINEVESIFIEKVMFSTKKRTDVVAQTNLLDDTSDTTDGGLSVLGDQMLLEKIDNLLNKLRVLKTERTEAVQSLKALAHQDDISSLLLLNKNKESQVFQTELAKFKPMQNKLALNFQSHATAINDLTVEFNKIKETSQNFQKIELQEKTMAKIQKDWKRSFEQWRDAKEGLKKGVEFYTDLSEIVEGIKKTVEEFTRKRADERTALIKKIENDNMERGQRVLREQLQRLSVNTASPVSPALSSVSSQNVTTTRLVGEPQNVPISNQPTPYQSSMFNPQQTVQPSAPQDYSSPYQPQISHPPASEVPLNQTMPSPYQPSYPQFGGPEPQYHQVPANPNYTQQIPYRPQPPVNPSFSGQMQMPYGQQQPYANPPANYGVVPPRPNVEGYNSVLPSIPPKPVTPNVLQPPIPPKIKSTDSPNIPTNPNIAPYQQPQSQNYYGQPQQPPFNPPPNPMQNQAPQQYGYQSQYQQPTGYQPIQQTPIPNQRYSQQYEQPSVGYQIPQTSYSMPRNNAYGMQQQPYVPGQPAPTGYGMQMPGYNQPNPQAPNTYSSGPNQPGQPYPNMLQPNRQFGNNGSSLLD